MSLTWAFAVTAVVCLTSGIKIIATECASIAEKRMKMKIAGTCTIIICAVVCAIGLAAVLRGCA